VSLVLLPSDDECAWVWNLSSSGTAAIAIGLSSLRWRGSLLCCPLYRNPKVIVAVEVLLELRGKADEWGTAADQRSKLQSAPERQSKRGALPEPLSAPLPSFAESAESAGGEAASAKSPAQRSESGEPSTTVVAQSYRAKSVVRHATPPGSTAR